MRRATVIATCLVTSGLIASVFGYILLRTQSTYADHIRSWYYRHPLIECPSQIEIEEADLSQKIDATFHLSNSGHESLVLSNIRTNCSCIGLEQRQGDGYIQRPEYVIAPGESSDFVLRFTAVGLPGQPFAVSVYFATNDPRRPEVEVQALCKHIRTGILTDPPEVLLSKVPLNAGYTHRVGLRDGYPNPRGVRSVRSLAPGVVNCSFVPLPKGAAVEERNNLGALVGFLDLSIRADRPGHFSVMIEIESDEPMPIITTARVSGMVVPPISVVPSALSLPRFTGQGLVYEGKCICRSVSDGSIVVTLKNVPKALEAYVEPPDKTKSSFVVIRAVVRPECRQKGVPEPVIIGLEASVGGQLSYIEIPVSIQAEGVAQ